MGLASSYTHLSGTKDWQRRRLMIEELWEDFLLKCEGDFHRSQSGQEHTFMNVIYCKLA